MSAASPSPSPAPPAVSWGIALAAGSLLLIAGGTVIWSCRDADRSLFDDAPAVASAPPTSDQLPQAVTTRRPLPPPPMSVAFHSVVYTMENGTQVVKIRVTEGGDELVVDAATGRFLEARPTRPVERAPGGLKVAAPIDPMT